MSQQNVLEVVKEELRSVVTIMKSVSGFQIGDPVRSAASAMAKAIEKGRTDDAILAGQEAIKAARNILGAFLRYSVFDKNFEGGQVRTARFTLEIARRRDEEKYDADLIKRLDDLRKGLEESVRAETNGTFSARVSAYNALNTELGKVDDEQFRRDRVRDQQAKATKMASRNQKDAEATARNKVVAETERQRLLNSRKQSADEIRGLL